MIRIKTHFLSILIFLVISSSTASAQTDYIIDNDGAKIMGKVKSITFETVKFIPDGEKKAEKFSPNQIKE